MDDTELAELRARVLARVALVLDDELGAVAAGLPAAPKRPAEDRPPLGYVDPVEYWISIPEELWRADTLNVGPPDGKLWLSAKQTEGALGRGETFVRGLIRDYPIGIMYGGQWVVNRHRAVAAMYGRLAPRKKAEN